MEKKNLRKNSSLILSLLLFFNLITPVAQPLVGYAEEAEAVEETEEVENLEESSDEEKSDEKSDDEVGEEIEEDSEPAEPETEDEGSKEKEEELEVETSEEEETEEEPENESEEIVEEELTAVAVEEDEESEDEEEFVLPIMHMNDTHAHVENYPYLTTLVKNYRSKHPSSLLLHGGDVFSGTLYFNEFKGQADIALLNLMDIDAMVFGNHEFDLGNQENGHESLAKLVDTANFPILGTNTNLSKDPYLKKYHPKASLVRNASAGDVYDSIIVEREGEEIGIFGLTTEDTKNIASPMSVTFSNYIETAKTEVKKLEDAGIDKIIAVTHLGFDSAPAVGNDLLLAEHVNGIDVVVGGHSHTEVEPPRLVEKDGEASTVVVQAGEYAENLGTVEVTFNSEGEVVDFDGELLAIEENYEKVVEPDAEALAALAPFKTKVDKLATQEIGATAEIELINPRASSEEDIDAGKQSVRAHETALGNLVTDAMLAKSKEKESDIVIAMQNGGGIRTSIPKGPITNGEVIEVLPFGNNPVVVELSGAEIKEILEHAVHKAPYENGGFLHISGMKYYYDSHKPAGDRVVKMYVVDENGEETEINPSENYKITTNGFTGQGGDGFDTFAQAFKDGRVRDLGESDWEQLADYMVDEKYLGGVVHPKIEGRIIDLKGEDLVEEPSQPEDLDTEKLEAIVAKASKVNKEQYTPASYAALEDALALPATTQEEIDEKEQAIQKAYDNLEEKSSVTGGAEEETSDQTESKLPQTGEAEYSGVLIGTLTIVAGTTVLVITHRKKKESLES